MAGREKVFNVAYKLVIVVWFCVHLQCAGSASAQTINPDAIAIESTLMGNVSAAATATAAAVTETLELRNVSVSDVEITNSAGTANESAISLSNGTASSASAKHENIELDKEIEANITNGVFNVTHNGVAANADEVAATSNCTGFPV